MSDTAKPQVVEVDGLVKGYGTVEAVRDVDLTVRSGQMYGLIGPDGAGKTTLLRILCGLLLRDEGSLNLMGYDPGIEQHKLKELIGYMPQRFSLYPDLSVAENMRFFADIYHIGKSERLSRTERLLKFSRLGPFSERKASALSGGMKQKLALSCTMIHTPDLLILDEPTTGVDPVSRGEFWDILAELKKEGVTILVTTPYMDEAALCDEISLMYGGRILASGTPDRITADFPFKLIQVYTESAYEVSEVLKDVREFEAVVIYGDRVHVLVHDAKVGIELVRNTLIQTGLPFHSIQEGSPDLEDVFVYLVGLEK